MADNRNNNRNSHHENTVAIQVSLIAFAAVLGMGLVGMLDGPINAFMDLVLREEFNRFDRAITHLLGPQNMADEIRRTAFWDFFVLLIWLGLTASAMSYQGAKLVLRLSSHREGGASNT